MTLTLKQTDLYTFERLVSKISKPTDISLVRFMPHKSGVRLAAFSKDAVLAMDVANTDFSDSFALSWATLKTLTAKKNIDVLFDLQKDSVSVKIGDTQRWVPREKQMNTLPSNPPTTVTHSKQLLEVLQMASKCTDPNNNRFALEGICLRGEKSQVLATTGTQLLVQEGFEYPWKDDVICPVAKIFGCKELKEVDTDEVLLGYVESGWVYFSVGEVSFWLRAIEGKFPKVAQMSACFQAAVH